MRRSPAKTEDKIINTPSQPKRVLVVEDDMLVAMLIEEMLIDLGYVVVGMAMRLEQGLAAARVVDADVAILDVNLDGKESFPIAEVLKSRNLPFFFATGYGSKGLNPAFEGTLTLNKPFQTDELKAAFEAVCP